jgi:hypothetical protein
VAAECSEQITRICDGRQPPRVQGPMTMTEPLLLVADLLYQLGQALWTGVVVVVFVQIWPEAKRRQYKQALDAYEGAVGRQAGVGSGQAPGRRARRTHNFSSLCW